MTPEEFQRVDAVFQRAIALPPGERPRFLDEACDGDGALRSKVESLLARDAKPHEILRVDLTRIGAEAEAEATARDASGTAGPLPERIGRYRVLDVLGVGGMGVVYRAEQENPRRVVALKLVRPGAFSPQVLRRFEQEGHVLGRLQHPGIAHIFEAGTADDGAGRQPYFAMELVDGRPLLEHAEAEGLGTRERVELLARICDALEHAHGKGVVHRDLKPGNILVPAAAPGDVGQPKVLDFGVARAVGSDLATTTLRTDLGQLVGTLPYMSPEQIAGDPAAIDARCDVYALGVILFELLTGRLPHDVVDTPLPEAARMIRDDEPTRLGTVDRAFRGDLDTIVAKALEKDLPRRYASAAALAADLRRYLADEPIVARPPTTLYQLRKFARRHKTLVGGVVAVMLVLAAGLVVSTGLYVRAEQRAEVLRRTLYAHRIALAQSAYDVADGTKMARLLEECPEDLRHWEWDRLAYLADRSVRTFRGHGAGIGAVAFTPDGRRLVTTGIFPGNSPEEYRDATVRIWDVETGRALMVLREHDGPVRALAVSPDGARLATGTGATSDPRIVVWDAATGTVLHTLEAPDGCTNRLAFFDEGRRVLAGFEGVYALDADTGGVLMEHGRHPSGVTGLAVSPDGATVVSVGWEGTLRVGDLRTGRELRTTEAHGGLAISAVAMSPDGATIATAGHDRVVRLWDLATGAPRGALRGHAHHVSAVAYGRDGRRLVSGSESGTIRVWDLDTGETRRMLHGHQRPIRDLAVSPDGRSIASASEDGTAKLWRMETPEDTVVVKAHAPETNQVAWDRAGNRVATTGDDGAARIFDAASGAELRRFDHGGRFVSGVAWSRDDARLVTGGWQGWMQLWDVATGASITRWRGHERSVRTIHFSPDGTRIVSSGWDGLVKLWDATTGALRRELHGLEGLVETVVWSTDGAQVIAADQSGTLLIWSADDGAIEHSLPVTQWGIESLALRRDGRRLAIGDGAGVVHVWDLARDRLVVEIQAHSRQCRTVAFSPDGRRIVSGGFDQRVRLFDAESGQLMLTVGYESGVIGVAFSPRGDRIAVASGDELRILKTRDDGPDRARDAGPTAAPGLR